MFLIYRKALEILSVEKDEVTSLTLQAQSFCDAVANQFIKFSNVIKINQRHQRNDFDNKRKTGTDMRTKNLLKHPEVKDIVTKAVAGVDGDAYIIGDSEWADGTQSDVLYVPKDESLGHAPIIIEINQALYLSLSEVPDITCVGYFLYQCNKWHPNEAP
ncbi:hypothetical protein RO3G_15389 [Rhizopus delemar RA 99-880]|uniref:Uncharacterized protein n=1 Tax=Rhizopus delemar (strain RA 99-880 / ATCC MYA-4621 / FGSC 9543 / NRRL 43880) TaxID=246409 RepID=I1CQE8_RHIO9|nr:hypothetical protein RO3G_15389 [Rhizopus delemar RA 99-880]|eukprot:EIE90678.1 hypothetical protein RO3G_15389 [Rhizopus delemar RA 99-880]